MSRGIVWLCVGVLLGVSVTARGQDLRAYRQPSVPDGWKEIPFVETAARPVLTDEELRRGYLLFSRPITEPVYANTHPLPHERLERLEAFATPGEFEPVTLSLYPVRDLRDFSVRVSDLVSSENRIASSYIDVRLVTYWNMRYPRYSSEGTYRRVPELLEKVTAHSSPRYECQRWWLTVHVPENARPGLYRGIVTLQEGNGAKPTRIPLLLRVLGFKLLRDPHKHLSAYYYPRNRSMFDGKDDAFVDRATANEYQSMVEHGLDILPTMYLQMDRESGKIVVQDAQEIERMLAAGMKGPLPVLGGNAIARIYYDTTPGAKRASHWEIEKMPPPEFYAKVTTAFRQLKEDAEAEGWPELICCPLDEVAASSKEFGARVYQAVKAAGIRTYATKNPRAVDAADYANHVDVWCSQPFAKPYQQVIADPRHEYWSYPNHNACERKNRRVMCKGGRMTYGFGFWRSGYTTLIPWHWAWTMRPDPMDYLRTRRSGCGQRIDSRGEVIPAIYWECFREGHDDGRYLYTLQQTAWERVGSDNAECRAAVESARRLLQRTWDSIDVQERYFEDDMWPSREFNARRWEMAVLIEQLQKYPIVREGTAPSVFVARTETASGVAGGTNDRGVDRAADRTDDIESFDLGGDFSSWRVETPEASITIESRRSAQNADDSATLHWRVDVDHHGGGQADGKYNVGWPRVRRAFSKGTLDLTGYDFLELVVQVDSNRDEVQDDVTMLGVSFSSHEGGRLYEFQHDLGDRQRESIRLRFPIAEMVRAAGKGKTPWQSLAYLQLFISEANYPHGAKLRFDIESIRLLRYRRPVVSELDVPSLMTVPAKNLVIPFELMGTRSVGSATHRLVVRLVSKDGSECAEGKADLDTERVVVVDTSRLEAGDYRIETEIVSRASKRPGPTRNLRVIDGPFAVLDDKNRVGDMREAPQWKEIELTFEASRDEANPYTGVEAWVDFVHESGAVLRRPMFWDGGRIYRVRFASTRAAGVWHWASASTNGDPGLNRDSGLLRSMPADEQHPTVFSRHGLWRIPAGGRNLVHADETPRLMCADTAWALPWRATEQQVEAYAADREQKGYNAVLVMTVMPDMRAKGPRSRTEDGGFDVGFEDLPAGSLRELNPAYFQTFDRLVAILNRHGLAVVYQPVFHGYGWKGQGTAGNVVSAEDYARSCRYLVARYGARPAIWLIGGDGPATDPQVVHQLDVAGGTIEEWDCYGQPTGIHYAPHALNRTHQEKAWLDFQWCQTGHSGEHLPERVADMRRNIPVKAVANGEPTYENIGRVGRGAGWWQGHEVWCNLTAGGTMGVVYGAASLWQWRLHPREPGHADWCTAKDAGWREALAFEGSIYPGIAARIFDGLPLAGMEPNWTCTYGRRGLLVPGKLFVLYLASGGSTQILSRDVPRAYRVYDPKTGNVVGKGVLADNERATIDSRGDGEPRVIVFSAD